MDESPLPIPAAICRVFLRSDAYRAGMNSQAIITGFNSLSANYKKCRPNMQASFCIHLTTLHSVSPAKKVDEPRQQKTMDVEIFYNLQKRKTEDFLML